MIEPQTKIPFSLDELVTTMTFHSELSESYLNVKTGEMLFRNLETMEDETETEELGNDWVLIPSISSRDSYRWMEAFVDSLPQGILVEKLGIALNGKGAFRRFKDVLAGYPAQRQAWFDFENQKVVQEAKDWIEATAPHLLD